MEEGIRKSSGLEKLEDMFCSSFVFLFVPPLSPKGASDKTAKTLSPSATPNQKIYKHSAIVRVMF